MGDMEERPGGTTGPPLPRGPKRMLDEKPKALLGVIDGDGNGSSIGNEGGGG